MNKEWNLSKLERQAIVNQNFDDYVIKESGILEYNDLSVLDIGCSNGFKTKMLFDKYKNITNIYGIDVDKNAIDEANNIFKGDNRYKFQLKNIENLEINKKYDIICLSYVLQHLKKPKEILKKLKTYLSDRGVIIIKVPDDSFKFCYPNNDLLLKIFDLYESEIMRKSDITKNTDRYIGKKVYNYLSQNNYTNIKVYYNITDTSNKDEEEKLKLFESSISFRSAKNKDNISNEISQKMENLLAEMKNSFKEKNFYYTMTVLYYIAKK